MHNDMLMWTKFNLCNGPLTLIIWLYCQIYMCTYVCVVKDFLWKFFFFRTHERTTIIIKRVKWVHVKGCMYVCKMKNLVTTSWQKRQYTKTRERWHQLHIHTKWRERGRQRRRRWCIWCDIYEYNLHSLWFLIWSWWYRLGVLYSYLCMYIWV